MSANSRRGSCDKSKRCENVKKQSCKFADKLRERKKSSKKSTCKYIVDSVPEICHKERKCNARCKQRVTSHCWSQCVSREERRKLQKHTRAWSQSRISWWSGSSIASSVTGAGNSISRQLIHRKTHRKMTLALSCKARQKE